MPQTQQEEWRDVVGWEGSYQISNLGRVRSLFRYKKILTPRNRSGYKIVDLCRNGKKQAVSVHRLVATAFLPNPNNMPFVNHKDECRANNVVGNLEWCTNQYNITYGTAQLRKKLHKDYKPMMKSVMQLNDTGLVATYESVEKAAKAICPGNPYAASNIATACREKRYAKKSYGFYWQYEKERTT